MLQGHDQSHNAETLQHVLIANAAARVQAQAFNLDEVRSFTAYQGWVWRVQAAAAQGTLEKLSESEERAKSAHDGLWMYGDPGSESEEDEPARKAWGRR